MTAANARLNFEKEALAKQLGLAKAETEANLLLLTQARTEIVAVKEEHKVSSEGVTAAKAQLISVQADLARAKEALAGAKKAQQAAVQASAEARAQETAARGHSASLAAQHEKSARDTSAADAKLQEVRAKVADAERTLAALRAKVGELVVDQDRKAPAAAAAAAAAAATATAVADAAAAAAVKPVAGGDTMVVAGPSATDAMPVVHSATGAMPVVHSATGAAAVEGRSATGGMPAWGRSATGATPLVGLDMTPTIIAPLHHPGTRWYHPGPTLRPHPGPTLRLRPGVAPWQHPDVTLQHFGVTPLYRPHYPGVVPRAAGVTPRHHPGGGQPATHSLVPFDTTVNDASHLIVNVKLPGASTDARPPAEEVEKLKALFAQSKFASTPPSGNTLVVIILNLRMCVRVYVSIAGCILKVLHDRLDSFNDFLPHRGMGCKDRGLIGLR